MNIKLFNKKDILVFFLFLLIFYGIFRYPGSFGKGYNIYEDCHIITTSQSLDTNSFTSVYSKMIKSELEGWKRFRPVWLIYMLTVIEIFGFNLILLNIFVAFLCISTAFLLYKFCINIGFNTLQSILFSLLTLIGPATIMYTRPPDAEIIGMFMLSLSLFFLSKSIYSNKNNQFYQICFILSLSITTLCKESFLIITPAVLFLYIMIYSSRNKIGMLQSTKKNYKIIILISALSIAILVLLIQLVGIKTTHGYSGVDIRLFSGKTIIDFVNTIFKSYIFLVVLFGIFILFENELFNYNKNKDNSYKYIIYSTLKILFFMILVILPQFIVYYKSGFTERYYLPYLMGYSFSIIFLLKYIFDNKTISAFLKYFYLTTVLLFLSLEIVTVTIPSISKYSKECYATTQVAQTIANNKNKDVLIVMDAAQNYHEVYSLKIFIDYLKGQKDYKYDFIKKDFLIPVFYDSVYYNKVLKTSVNLLGNKLIDSAKNNSDINTVFICGNLNEKFLLKNKLWFNNSKFRKQQFGKWILYTKE